MICPLCRTESQEGTPDCPKCGLHFVQKQKKTDLTARHWEVNEIIAAIFGICALASTAYFWWQYGFQDTFTIVSLAVTVICLLYFLVSALERWLNSI